MYRSPLVALTMTAALDRGLNTCSAEVNAAGGDLYDSSCPNRSDIIVSTWSLNPEGAVTAQDLYFTVFVAC